MLPIQEKLLELVIEIDQICRKHQIEYYLTGGTALGAVRHGGFLPWDDDVDLYITRKNYLKLVEVMRTEIRPDREFLCSELNPDFPYPYGRYMDRNTTAIYRSYSLGFGGAGVNVDFILLDNLPNDENERKEFIERYRALYEYAVDYYTLTRKSSNARYRENLKKGRKLGRNTFLEQEKQAIYFAYRDEDCDCYFQNLPFWPHVLPKKIFGKPTYVKFEYTELPVAEHVTDYLRIGYGDDWYMIPEQTEIRTHITTNNLEIGYQNFFRDYLPFINIEEAQENNRRQKYYDMQINSIAPQAEKMNLDMLSYTLRLDLAERKRMEQIDTAQLLADAEYGRLREFYKSYYTLQLGKTALYWEYYVDLPDEDLIAALYSILVSGDYGKVRTILLLRQQNCGTPQGDVQKLYQLVEQLRDMSISFEHGEFENARALFNEICDKNPDIIDIIRARIRFAAADAATAEALLSYAQQQAKKYPRDGEIRKYYGDLLMQTGCAAQAQREYRLAARYSMNGMLLRELSEMNIPIRRSWTEDMYPVMLHVVKEDKDLRRVISYLKQDIANCLYMYIDLQVYGLQHPQMRVWAQQDAQEELELVVMKYYDSIQLFSSVQDISRLDLEEAARLIEQEKPAMVSGRLDLIEHLMGFLDDIYTLTSGYVYQLDSYRKIEDNGLVSMAEPEDAQEIAELICMDDGTFAHCDVSNLTKQFAERMKTQMGRSYIIRKNGKIIAHSATYAEYDGIAVGSGLMIHPDYRNQLYDAIIDSYLIRDLKEKNIKLYTFLTNPSRVRLFQVMGNKECGRYGKLTLKRQEEEDNESR